MTTLTTNADEPNDDQRHSRDLWAEEDIGSILERLHDQVTRLGQAWSAGGRTLPGSSQDGEQKLSSQQDILNKGRW